MPKLSKFSETNLVGVHPALDKLVRRAILGFDFRVMDGVRTVAEQRVNVANGASQTMNSRHFPQADGFSHAVDLVPCISAGCEPQWSSPVFIERQKLLGQFVKGVALGLGISITWGGDWTGFVDMPHFQFEVG